MHDNEDWQLYSKNGEAVSGDGYALPDNPREGAKEYVAASCAWLYRHADDGIEVLFQKRSHFVSRNPDFWDVSTAGHVNFGETEPEAMVREAREEIGAEIDAGKLEFVFAVLSNDGYNLINYYYLYDCTGEKMDFKFDDKEVSEVKWVPLAEFDKFIDEYAKPALKNAKFTRGMTKAFLQKKLR